MFLIYRVPKVIFHPVSMYSLTFQNSLQFHWDHFQEGILFIFSAGIQLYKWR